MEELNKWIQTNIIEKLDTPPVVTIKEGTILLEYGEPSAFDPYLCFEISTKTAKYRFDDGVQCMLEKPIKKENILDFIELNPFNLDYQIIMENEIEQELL